MASAPKNPAPTKYVGWGPRVPVLPNNDELDLTATSKVRKFEMALAVRSGCSKWGT